MTSDLKHELQTTLHQFLKLRFPVEKRNSSSQLLILFKIHGQYVSYRSDAVQGECSMSNQSLEISQEAQLNNSLYLYHFLSVQEQQHILQLLNYIAQFKASKDELDPGSSQLDLWSSFNSYVNTMPGFWSVFSKLRPLSRQLKLTLNEFAPADLREQDNLLSLKVIKNLKERLDNLITRFNILMTRFEALQQENDALKKMVEDGLMSAQFAEEQSRVNYNTLMQEKDDLNQEFESLNKRYNALHVSWESWKSKATQLFTANTLLSQDKSKLQKQVENLSSALEMSVIKLQESEELMDNMVDTYSGIRTENVSVAEIEKINEYYRRIRGKRSSVVLFQPASVINSSESKPAKQFSPS